MLLQQVFKGYMPFLCLQKYKNNLLSQTKDLIKNNYFLTLFLTEQVVFLLFSHISSKK